MFKTRNHRALLAMTLRTKKVSGFLLEESLLGLLYFSGVFALRYRARKLGSRSSSIRLDCLFPESVNVLGRGVQKRLKISGMSTFM